MALENEAVQKVSELGRIVTLGCQLLPRNPSNAKELLEKVLVLVEAHPQLRHGVAFAETHRLVSESGRDAPPEALALHTLAGVDAVLDIATHQLMGTSEKVNRLVEAMFSAGVEEALALLFGEIPLPEALARVVPSLAAQWHRRTVEPTETELAWEEYRGGPLSPLQFRGLVEVLLKFAERDGDIPVSENAAERAVRKAEKGPPLRERLGNFVGEKFVFGNKLPEKGKLAARALDYYLKSFGREIE